MLSLPNELLLQITTYEPFRSLELTVAFAITCQRLFELTRDSVEHARDCCAAPWAFCRVVCLGDYAEYEDVPKTLYTAAELAVIEEKCKNGNKDEVDTTYGGIHMLGIDSCELRLGAYEYQNPRLWRDETNEWLARFTKADRKRFDALMAITYPDRADWVLANLSKKEYVRASEIAKLARRPDDPQPFLPNCFPDLGHALLTRIAWSSDNSLSMGSNEVTENLHRGKWVGDKMCIVTLDRLMAAEYADISTTVVRDLIYCCKADYGERWLEAIEKEWAEDEIYEMHWMASDGDDRLARYCRLIGERPQRPWFW